MAIPKKVYKNYFTYTEYKGTPSMEVLPDLRINLRKVFDMENYDETANERQPGYSLTSSEKQTVTAK